MGKSTRLANVCHSLLQNDKRVRVNPNRGFKCLALHLYVMAPKQLKSRAKVTAVSKPIRSSKRARDDPVMWASMLADPYGHKTVLSPAGTGNLASEAKLVRTIDLVSATDTHDGDFAIIARPSLVDPILRVDSSDRLPSVGTDRLLLSGIFTFLDDSTEVGKPEAGHCSVALGTDPYSAQRMLHLAPEGSPVTNAFRFTVDGNSSIIWSIHNPHDKGLYCRISRYGASWTAGANTNIPGRSTIDIGMSGFGGVDQTAWTMVLTDSNNNPINPQSKLNVSFSANALLGFIPASDGSTIVGSFVDRSLVDAAHVSNARVTAMSVLVTNMASATNDGGEIVTACTRQEIAFRSQNVSDLMSNIKNLPETNRWYSGNVSNGGYTFYAPDDLESYEPNDYGHLNIQDNCCLVAGTLDPGGKVRVTIVYVVEFYTPSQLFKRRIGPAWDSQYKHALQILLAGRMASGNEEHETMVKRITKSLKSAAQFFLDNKEDIAKAAEIAAMFL